MDAPAPATRRYTYDTPFVSYSLAWASRSDPRFRIAVGSSVEGDANRIHVIELREETKRLELVAEIEHTFPPTKLMWKPDDGESKRSSADLLAGSCTTLNLWKLEDGQVKNVAKLANTRGPNQGGSGHLPPITSFDWSVANEHKIGISSVDTTCTIWNIERQKIETQLIAHDKAVYDIAFTQIDNLFTSVGADGSVRLFDQRNLDHSTIIYETSPATPLLRVAWNKLNTNYVATIAMDSPGVIIFDLRRPSVALRELAYNDSCVNHIAWAPHSRDHLLCGTNSGSALIWDVKDAQPDRQNHDPAAAAAAAAARGGRTAAAGLVAYECEHEIYQVQWPGAQPDMVALGMPKQVAIIDV
eukprot:TRINITY_DN1888_c0_g1_i1.p1 TRINITY_DN1888_c0_g1~~TRINITY_DN1888_c0_g1_i1.p1  ORF type:complete len:357 (-),score=60.32 TRINITY_DN1888_c0_g1_i1:345-1415(-)